MATYHLRRWSLPPTFPGNELYKEPWDWMMDNDYIDGWWIIIIDDYNNDNDDDDDDDATCCHASQTPHRCSIVAYSYHKRSKPSGKPGDHNGDHHDHQLHHAHYLLPPHHHHPQHHPPHPHNLRRWHTQQITWVAPLSVNRAWKQALPIMVGISRLINNIINPYELPKQKHISGNNLRLAPDYGVESFQGCRALCRKEKRWILRRFFRFYSCTFRCAYFTHDSENSWCYLKTAKTAPRSKKGSDKRYKSKYSKHRILTIYEIKFSF